MAAPQWPTAGVAEVDLAQRAATLGTLPVKITGDAAVGKVKAEVVKAGGDYPVVLRVSRTGGAKAAAKAGITVDYSKFKDAYGADWATRLRLVQLPECALSTPDKQECAAVPIRSSRNNVKAATVSVEQDVAPAGTLLAVAAASSGPAGDYGATPLAPSSSWQAGGSSVAERGRADRGQQQPALVDRRGVRAGPGFDRPPLQELFRGHGR
jgi:hypothetical protein